MIIIDELKKLKSYRDMIAIVVVLLLLLYKFSSTPTGDYFESYLAHSLHLKSRLYFKKAPLISKKIKTFVFDDAAIAVTKTPDLELDAWYKMIAAVDKQNPKAIIIDKVFGIPLGDVDKFVNNMKSIKSQVIIGGFYSESKINNRYTLDETTEHSIGRDFYSLPKIKKEQIFNIYGPHHTLQNSFTSIGHIVYAGNGYFKPYYRYSDTHIFPHLSFLVNPDIKLNSDHLLLSNGKKVPYDRFGRVAYNFNSPNEYVKHTYGASALYLRAYNGKPVYVVEEGDIVLILPLMFTGNTDWIPTPIGSIPGGYLLHSAIQSALEENYIIKYDRHILLWLILVSLLSLLILILLDSKWFWGSFFAVVALLICSSIYLFVYHSIFVSWFYPTIQFCLASLLFISKKSYIERGSQLRMEHELQTAQVVQEYFYPTPNFECKDLIGHGLTSGASECSGDWWHHYKYNDNTLYLAIGDVMGHGTSAALVTSMVYSHITDALNPDLNIGQAAPDPSEVLQKLNYLIYTTMKSKITMTLFLIKFDLIKMQATYANAGHNFPFFIEISPNQVKSSSFKTTGSSLGFSDVFNSISKVVELNTESRIFAYTDGLTENENAKQKTLTRKKLLQIIEESLNLDPKDANNYILKKSQEHFKTKDQVDDITLISVNLKPANRNT